MLLTFIRLLRSAVWHSIFWMKCRILRFTIVPMKPSIYALEYTLDLVLQVRCPSTVFVLIVLFSVLRVPRHQTVTIHR